MDFELTGNLDYPYSGLTGTHLYLLSFRRKKTGDIQKSEPSDIGEAAKQYCPYKIRTKALTIHWYTSKLFLQLHVVQWNPRNSKLRTIGQKFKNVFWANLHNAKRNAKLKKNCAIQKSQPKTDLNQAGTTVYISVPFLSGKISDAGTETTVLGYILP